jgi:hypothetical protein
LSLQFWHLKGLCALILRYLNSLLISHILSNLVHLPRFGQVDSASFGICNRFVHQFYASPCAIASSPYQLTYQEDNLYFTNGLNYL